MRTRVILLWVHPVLYILSVNNSIKNTGSCSSFRPHQMHAMRSIATDDLVAWCVCQSVRNVLAPAEQINVLFGWRRKIVLYGKGEQSRDTFSHFTCLRGGDSMRLSPNYFVVLFLQLSAMHWMMTMTWLITKRTATISMRICVRCDDAFHSRSVCIITALVVIELYISLCQYIWM